MSFAIFVVTCRVTDFLPKLINMPLFLMEKTEFPFFEIPYFRQLPNINKSAVIPTEFDSVLSNYFIQYTLLLELGSVYTRCVRENTSPMHMFASVTQEPTSGQSLHHSVVT